MALEQREQGETRHSILDLLRRRGPMTASELSDALGVGAVGIRQHLALLERDALVHVSSVRRSVGRPSHLYELTPAAEQLFPKRYDRIAMDALTFVEAAGGPEAITQLFERRRTALASQYRQRLNGKHGAEQVAELATILTEHGYMCEWARLDDGSFLLTEHNCPIDCVARAYPQACAQELQLYQELLGGTVEREETIAGGGRHCCYRIKPT